MVPSLTAVDDEGRPLTPGLLYGDSRGRGPAGADTTFLSGETVEFLRWTAREAPDAKGYWPATAVANHALAGEAVLDNATASTTYPLFDGTGWSEDACAECGATGDRMPRVEPTGGAVGQLRDADAVLAAVDRVRHAERAVRHLRQIAADFQERRPAFIPALALQDGLDREMRGAGA